MAQGGNMKTRYAGDGQLFLGSRTTSWPFYSFHVPFIIKMGDKWFAASYCSEPKVSMIEALVEAYGRSICSLERGLCALGLTLSDCASDDLSDTLDKLKKCLEYEERNAKKVGYVHRLILFHLVKLKEAAIGGPTEIIELLDEMQKTLSVYPVKSRNL